jgi:hypothetical protein
MYCQVNVAGELVVLDHLEIMAANGFDFDVDETAPAGALSAGGSEPGVLGGDHSLANCVTSSPRVCARGGCDQTAGRRLRLKTVPMSKSVTFGADDVYELISLLTARPGVMCVVCSMAQWVEVVVVPSPIRCIAAVN